jgi:hypothetical protein
MRETTMTDRYHTPEANRRPSRVDIQQALQSPAALTPEALPNAEAAYLEQIVKTLRSRLKQRLVGAYLFGSAAYGSYEPGISDLDVQAVVTEPLSKRERKEIANCLAHQTLPCPARRLEFVGYAKPSINPATHHPQFEMNFNTGTDEPDHLSLNPAEEPSHWFLLDVAIGRELGRCLMGPEPAQVFASIPRLWQLEAIIDSLAWHRKHEPTSANNVLNACRGWRYAVTGMWGSKLAGAAWARQQRACSAIVEHVGPRRQGGPQPHASAVTELVEIVIEAVQLAILREQSVQLFQ